MPALERGTAAALRVVRAHRLAVENGSRFDDGQDEIESEEVRGIATVEVGQFDTAVATINRSATRIRLERPAAFVAAKTRACARPASESKGEDPTSRRRCYCGCCATWVRSCGGSSSGSIFGRDRRLIVQRGIMGEADYSADDSRLISYAKFGPWGSPSSFEPARLALR